jgi:hypothetical protein
VPPGAVEDRRQRRDQLVAIVELGQLSAAASARRTRARPRDVDHLVARAVGDPRRHGHRRPATAGGVDRQGVIEEADVDPGRPPLGVIEHLEPAVAPP